MAKYNRNFAKLNEGGSLVYAPLPLAVNEENVWTNVPEVYIGQGYYPIVKTEMPEKEGFYYTSYWAIEKKKCVQKWEEHEIIPEEPVSEEVTEEVIAEEIVEESAE